MITIMHKHEQFPNKNYRVIMSVMLISLIVDEWNVFLIPQTNTFVKPYFHLNNLSFGLVTAVVIGGAAIGSLIGLITALFVFREIYGYTEDLSILGVPLIEVA